MASYYKQSRAGGSTAGTTKNKVRHGECLRNYGVNEGHYVFDGCGEFINKGVEGTPDALICGACGCHRNFHRKIIEPQPPQPLQHCPPGVPPLSLFRHHVIKRAAAKQSSQSPFQLHNNPLKEETLSEET